MRTLVWGLCEVKQLRALCLRLVYSPEASSFHLQLDWLRALVTFVGGEQPFSVCSLKLQHPPEGAAELQNCLLTAEPAFSGSSRGPCNGRPLSPLWSVIVSRPSVSRALPVGMTYWWAVRHRRGNYLFPSLGAHSAVALLSSDRCVHRRLHIHSYIIWFTFQLKTQNHRKRFR